METEQRLISQIRRLIITFIVLLVLSGITAFPLEWELSILVDVTKDFPQFIREWLNGVYQAIKETNNKYPFMS